MDEAYGATVAKRRLARRLTELRVATGYTANQVCDRLTWGRGKVGRFEANQWKRPEMSDIRDLLRLYGVDEAEGRVLEDLAVLARARPWWREREYADVFANEYPGFEADACRIGVYMPLILPGLVQTPAYTDAHMQVGMMPADWRERALQARLRRQRILDRTDPPPPELTAVVTEASLRYRWGKRPDRREQLLHLIALGSRPRVTVRILRFADGPHPGMSSLINIFEFPGDEPAIVFLENDVHVEEVNAPEAVAAYRTTFAAIRDAALSPEETRDFLQHLTDTLE